jgi:hypothetical protein
MTADMEPKAWPVVGGAPGTPGNPGTPKHSTGKILLLGRLRSVIADPKSGKEYVAISRTSLEEYLRRVEMGDREYVKPKKSQKPKKPKESKSPAKKSPAKKSPAKKSPAKKSPAKKSKKSSK